MASSITATITPDAVVTFDLVPGTLSRFLESRVEGGPRLKCVEGRVILVSPGRTHETTAARLDLLILALCGALGLKRRSLASTTWTLPALAIDTAYEADRAYLIQNHASDDPDHPPDLALEVVVSHPADKALRAGEQLGIPELWVLDVPHRALTFHHLIHEGATATYRSEPRSRAFPCLTPEDVLARLDDPETDDLEFLENCQTWARTELLARRT